MTPRWPEGDARTPFFDGGIGGYVLDHQTVGGAFGLIRAV